MGAARAAPGAGGRTGGGALRRLAPLAVLGGLALAGCGSSGAPLHAGWQKGFNVTAYTPDGLGVPAADEVLRRLRADGTTSVALVVTWYEDHANSATPAPDPARTPSDDSVLHAMATARGLGMDVVLKPHVDLRDRGFRGRIAPPAPAAWFAAYQSMVDHYAELAARGAARGLVVGTELTSLSGEAARFRGLIASVRARFAGRLTYAANLVAEAQQVRFWDALDEIGIDAYMPLAGARQPDPPVAALVRAWAPYRRAIERLHRRWRRPVVFTELGYQAVRGAAVTPASTAGPPDGAAQARAYEAAFRAWGHLPWFAGIYWWDARTDGTGDDGFGALGRPAEAVVRRFNGVRRG